eukprot:SAG31_NODE_146_length_22601_cov_56.529192_28_plen_322_part_01
MGDLRPRDQAARKALARFRCACLPPLRLPSPCKSVVGAGERARALQSRRAHHAIRASCTASSTPDQTPDQTSKDLGPPTGPEDSIGSCHAHTDLSEDATLALHGRNTGPLSAIVPIDSAGKQQSPRQARIAAPLQAAPVPVAPEPADEDEFAAAAAAAWQREVQRRKQQQQQQQQRQQKHPGRDAVATLGTPNSKAEKPNHRATKSNRVATSKQAAATYHNTVDNSQQRQRTQASVTKAAKVTPTPAPQRVNAIDGAQRVSTAVRLQAQQDTAVTEPIPGIRKPTQNIATHSVTMPQAQQRGRVGRATAAEVKREAAALEQE